MSLCSTDCSPWPPGTSLHHCCKQFCVMQGAWMSFRCIFAQVSSHLTEVSGYCCLFTQLRSSCKFDQAIIRIRCFHNAYKLLATSTKCHSHSSPQWQIWISFCHKIPLMQFTKWILCHWDPFSHPFKLIWDKHKAWVTYDFMGQTH